jgi:outer membrane protein OmpA-like peptidoglycan-associated protein
VKIDTLTLNNILFDFDKYTIKNPGLLDQYSSLFDASTITRIEVAGYTDDAGSAEYNLELSRHRAEAVASLLGVRFSIPAGLIESSGKGISTRHEDKKLNRRVEIYIYRKNE